MTPKQRLQRQSVLIAAHHDFEKSLNLHAFSRLSDHAMGEDLVQDTFLKTWKYLVKGGQISVMRAFLYHILNNLIVDQYRKTRMSSLDILLEKGLDFGSDDSQSLFDILDGKAAILLIQRLPEAYRKVMRMRYIQHLTIGEMSLVTGQSKNAVSVQAYRGLEKLKVLYNTNTH